MCKDHHHGYTIAYEAGNKKGRIRVTALGLVGAFAQVEAWLFSNVPEAKEGFITMTGTHSGYQSRESAEEHGADFSVQDACEKHMEEMIQYQKEREEEARLLSQYG